MNRQMLPDDEELARLIHAAFEALPGPDEERLAAVGERLQADQHRDTRQSGRRGLAWYWLWLLLAGGGVAAAWWVNDYMNKTPVPEQTTRQLQEKIQAMPQSMNNKADALPGEAARNLDQESGAEQESPIIYKREGY